jgi:glutathione-regulated potassium-efflux system ancillary protein KefC
MEFLQTTTGINSIWVGSAFLAGFIFKRLHLPPMLGFLLSGFLMNYLGLTNGSLALDKIADLGIILLLFSIGLKLDLNGLTKPEIWGGSTVHALLTILFLTLLILGAKALGVTHLAHLNLAQAALIGLALSFSSTIFAIKFLEEKGEINAMHGLTSIGILIMQDLMAVFFLTLSKGEFPSIWALALPLFLLAIRPVLLHIIEHLGHGELLPLGGLFIALGVGTTSFAMVGLKPDLGALVIGMVIGSHPRSTELAASLYSFKDLFLVSFFFQIGLSGTPTINQTFIALGLVLALAVKSSLYFLILTRFRLRARTSLLATFALSNYSEFGLLVTAIAAQNDWLSPDWIIIVALALTFSFLLSAPLNSKANAIYDRLAPLLRHFETKTRHRDDSRIDLQGAEILVFGLGPFGSMAYDVTRERQGDKVLAVDRNMEIVKKHRQNGRRVIWGDATDYDFWRRIDLEKIKIIMLAFTNHQANMLALQEIQSTGFQGPVTASSRFDDHRLELEEAGATAAYNIFSEAGAGYADHVCRTTGLVCKTQFIIPDTGIPQYPAAGSEES